MTGSHRRPFTITSLHRHPVHGYWMARVTNGHTIEVDRRYGSWQAAVRDRPGARSKHREFVLPDVAAALQARVRVLEKRERDGQLSVVGAGHDMRDGSADALAAADRGIGLHELKPEGISALSR